MATETQPLGIDAGDADIRISDVAAGHSGGSTLDIPESNYEYEFEGNTPVTTSASVNADSADLLHPAYSRGRRARHSISFVTRPSPDVTSSSSFSSKAVIVHLPSLSPRSLQTLLRPTTLFPISDEQQADAPQSNPQTDEFLSCTVSVVAVGKQAKLTLQASHRPEPFIVVDINRNSLCVSRDHSPAPSCFLFFPFASFLLSFASAALCSAFNEKVLDCLGMSSSADESPSLSFAAKPLPTIPSVDVMDPAPATPPPSSPSVVAATTAPSAFLFEEHERLTLLSLWKGLQSPAPVIIGADDVVDMIGFAVMTASAPTKGLSADDLSHVDVKLFHPKTRSSMLRVTVALTQNVLAAWDTRSHRLLLLWEVSDIIVVESDFNDDENELALVIKRKNSNAQVSFLPLTHQLRPLSNWQGGGIASSSAQWRSRIIELGHSHSFVRTFHPPSWPFRHLPSTVELPQISCGTSLAVAVAPNIVWLLAEPATIIIVHLPLQKEIGRVKVPIERPMCAAVGDGVVVCWALPAASSGFEHNEGCSLLVLRASDCSTMVHKHLPIPAVRSCCISAGFIWAVTIDGLVSVMSLTGDILEDFDFRLQQGSGALSVCACPLAMSSSSSSDVLASGVAVSFHSGLCVFSMTDKTWRLFAIIYGTLFRYTAMSIGNSPVKSCTENLNGSNISSVRVFGFTGTGCLHVLHVSASGISLVHVIPSVRMVSSGISCSFEMVLASIMEEHDSMVMSLLDRSHFGSVHHLARITMHSNARAAFSQIFRGLLQSSASLPSPTMKCANFGLSDLQQTTILLQNTDFNWIEIKVPGSTPEAPSRAPGPNGMVACACTTKSGGTFSFLCLLVDAVPVKVDDVEIHQTISALSFSNTAPATKRTSAIGHKDTSGFSVASIKGRVLESRRRSSSADEYEGRLELLVFGPNSKQQQQDRVLMRDKALKCICLTDKPLIDTVQPDNEVPECSFCFKVQHGAVHITHDHVAALSSPSDECQLLDAPLQFYTSPTALHSGIASLPVRSARSLSPGTHVRMSVLQRFETAPELEHALMYCYLASMTDHSVDLDRSSMRVRSVQLPRDMDSHTEASSETETPDIGLSNERFRVKDSALRNHAARIPVRMPLQDELDLSQGVLAISTAHDIRHFASGSCTLTVAADGNILVIPPPPRIERLHVAAIAQSVDAVRQQERAHAFCIRPSTYLEDGQEGMVTFVANSVDKIRLGVNACRLEDATLTAPFVIEYGPFNPKVPWGEQIDTVQRRKLEFQDEHRLKRGIAYSSGASVSQISCGESFSIARMSDGSLWSWGTCLHGSLGHGPSVESLPRPKKISCQTLRFGYVSCGIHHVGALSSSYELYMWGSNHQGQLGLAKEKDSSEKSWLFSKDKDSAPVAVWTPTKVSLSVQGQGALGIQQVACGDYHTALLTTTGFILACGDNTHGQCCVYSAELFVNSFQLVTAIDGGPHAERTKTIVCGRNWTAAVMLCPNDIYVFGAPIGGTNKSMRKESMEIIEVSNIENSGGRRIVLQAQSAQDRIMLVYAQLPHNSRLNTTVDILENAAVMQRRHVKHLYKLQDVVSKLYLVALKKTESKERPLSEISSEVYKLRHAFMPEFMELIQRLISISNEFHDLILQQLALPITHKTFLNICAYMHKDFVQEFPQFIKLAPLNIEVVNTLIFFEQLFSAGKSKMKSERASMEKRQLMEFDFISKFVEIMTNMLSKEEGKKKGLQEFEFLRLGDLLTDLVKNLETPFEHLRTMRELYQHFYEQSCEFTTEDADPEACENMSSVKVLANRLLHDPDNGFIKLEDESQWALEVSKIPAITAEFEKASGRPRLLSPSGGTVVRMTRVRDDIKVAYPNLKNVAERWSSSDHPAFLNLQQADCHLSGVLVLLSDKLYLLEDCKKVIIQQFDLQHMWMTPVGTSSLDWIIMTPIISVFIKFQSQKDSDIVFAIAQATKDILASSYHLNNLRTQIANHTRAILKSDIMPDPLTQIAHIKGSCAKPCATTGKSSDKDSKLYSAKKWWDSFFAPNRFVVFLYNTGGSAGDLYIGNMTCGVRSGWGVLLCNSLQRTYSCFWRHDRPNGFGRVKELNATGNDISFCGFIESGQFGPAHDGLQPTALGCLVKKTSDGSSSYLGEFSGGKRHGQGKQKDATGKYKGWWELDVRHGPGILIQNGCTYEGNWCHDQRHCSSLLTTSSLGDVRASHWSKDHEYHGVSVSGNTILFGQKFQDGLVKGHCIIMSFHDSMCMIVSVEQRAPSSIQVVSSLHVNVSASEWDSTGHARTLAHQAVQEPLIFCNFNDMRDVFWPSIMPFTKAEMMSKGLLTSSGADAPKKDKDDWVMCMNEAAIGAVFEDAIKKDSHLYHKMAKFFVMFISNFWRACLKTCESHNAATLVMSRVCAMLQWSSEFLCNCVISANKGFATLSWQQPIHDIYIDYIADQKRLCELFSSEYKARDNAIKRVYESYRNILLSTTNKNSMTCCKCGTAQEFIVAKNHIKWCISCSQPSFPVSLANLATDSATALAWEDCIRELMYIGQEKSFKISASTQHIVNVFAKISNMAGTFLEADDLIPVIGYLILKAEVPHLISKIEMIEALLTENTRKDEIGCYLVNFRCALMVLEGLQTRMQISQPS